MTLFRENLGPVVTEEKILYGNCGSNRGLVGQKHERREGEGRSRLVGPDPEWFVLVGH